MVRFHEDKVNSRTDITEEQKETLRAHGKRVTSLKTNCDEELRFWIYLRALNTPRLYAARHVPVFFEAPGGQGISINPAGYEEVPTNPRASWADFLVKVEAAVWKSPPPDPPAPLRQEAPPPGRVSRSRRSSACL